MLDVWQAAKEDSQKEIEALNYDALRSLSHKDYEIEQLKAENENKYSIKEIRILIADFFDDRNAYKYIDEAAGHSATQVFLKSLEDK
jgi:hypothetical protein